MLYLWHVFAKLKNRSGSVSVQIISKSTGKYKVLKTIGSSSDEQEVQKLVYLANQEIERISHNPDYSFQKVIQLLSKFFPH